MPSLCDEIVPVAARSARSSVDDTTRPSAELSRRSRTRPKSRNWPVGLERYRRREMSESGAPAATSAAETARVRGVALGWANVAVSIMMPAIRAAARVPPPAVNGTPRRAASRATISQVAAECGSIQSVSPALSLDA